MRYSPEFEIAMALNRLTLAIGHAAILGKTSEQNQADSENLIGFLEGRVGSSLLDVMEDAESAIARISETGIASSEEIVYSRENMER